MSTKMSWSVKFIALFKELTSNKGTQVDVMLSKIHDFLFVVIRDLQGEGIATFLSEISNGLIDQMKSSDTPMDQLLSITMIVDLIISSEIDETFTRTYAKDIVDVLLKSQYPDVVSGAVKLLGKIVRVAPHDLVEVELDTAFKYLEKEPKTTGAMMVYHIALNNEVVCFMNQTRMIDLLINVLYDKNIQARIESQKALAVLLHLFTAKAEGFDLSPLYEQAVMYLKRMNNPDLQHGALLILTALLHNCREFMVSKFKEVLQIFLNNRENKIVIIKKTILQSLAEFANFDPTSFAPKNEVVAELYNKDIRTGQEFNSPENDDVRRVKVQEPLSGVMNYLVNCTRNFPEKNIVFSVIGDIAREVKSEMYPYLENVFTQIKSIVLSKEKQSEVLNAVMYCTQQLIEFIPVPRVFTLFYQIYPNLLENGISQNLVSLVKKACDVCSNPSYRHQIQKMLLDSICGILLGKAYIPFGAPEHLKMFNKVIVPSLDNSEQIILALNTLHSFKFKDNIIPVVKECIMKFIDSEDKGIRKESAMLIKVLLPPLDETKKVVSTLNVIDVLEKILEHGLSDGETEIRLTIVKLLDERFDNFLAQSKKIQTMFVVLNDENLKVREQAICIIGRLTKYNPAFVMPSFRKTIIRLLTQLKYSSDLKTNEEASLLMGRLIKSSERLIKPYVEPLLEDLLPKLEESIDKSHGETCIYLLNAIGDLTTIGNDLSAFVKRLMKCMITVLSDKGNTQKRSERRGAALSALGKLTRNIGYVVQPYYDYPELLGILLDLASNERTQSIKLELIKVFGIIGAIDTYKYKLLTEKDSANNNDDPDNSDNMLPTTQPGTDEFYALTVFSLLFEILRDNSLYIGHSQTVETFVGVVLYLNKKSLPFIPQILSIYLKLFKTCLPGVRPALIKGLADMMCLIEKNIREYLSDIVNLIQECWDETTVLPILSLVGEISSVMHDEFKTYMPKMLSLILTELNKYVFDQNSTVFESVINSIVVLSENIDFEDYLHLVIPTITDLVSEQVHHSIVLPTLKALYKFLQHVDAEEFISRLILPLTRLLPNPILRDTTMDVFCSVAERLGKPFIVYHQTIQIALNKYCPRYTHQRYESIVTKLKDTPDGPVLPLDDNEGQNVTISEDLHTQVTNFNQDSTGDTLSKDFSKIVLAWDTYKQRRSKEDWFDWVKQTAITFLKESPIHSLNLCHSLSTDHSPLARDLFNYAFLASWQDSTENAQRLVFCLKTVLENQSTPPEILQILLNLCEFMEREGIKVPIKSLGNYAKKCNAYAKALHYKEAEFLENPTTQLVEELIGLNNQLQNYDAAAGLIEYTKNLKKDQEESELNQTWFEKLGRWQKALDIYEKKIKDDSKNPELLVGKLNCLYELGDWEGLGETAKNIWESGDETVIETARPLYAAALWYLDQWDDFGRVVVEMTDNNFDTNFFRTINAINKGDFSKATDLIQKERTILDPELSALAGECYERAYSTVARAHMLAELEEVIMCKEGKYTQDAKSILKSAWTQKLVNAKADVSVWQKLLKIHSFVLSETENSDSWIKFTGLCYKSGMPKLAMKTLDRLAGISLDEHLNELPPAKLRIGVQYLNIQWKGAKDLEHRTKILETLNNFAKIIETRRSDDLALKADVSSKLGEWNLYIAQNSNSFNYDTIPRILQYYHATVQYDTENFKYWHSWALVNFEVVSYIENDEEMSEDTLVEYLRISIEGFVKSLILTKNSQTLQDTLRLLTILFKYGKYQEVEEAIVEGIRALPVDIWLHVIPQIIARIQSSVPAVKRVMTDLLTIIGKKHPQALVYPLTVASKSPSYDRRKTAMSVIEKIRTDSGHLVEQALLVGEELVRVAVLWHESWHESLEEASREFYINHNFNAMLSLLQPLYEKMEKGGETQNERGFLQSYGKDLKDAYDLCMRFKAKDKKATDKDHDIENAWELYFRIYKRIHKSINSVSVLELQQVSPRLTEARDLDIAVPGTYKAQNINNITRIKSIVPVLNIIPSKQRPRKLAIVGSNGVEYKFCLKGHEDLRQDERVMQLFGLVNDLLASNSATSTHHLNILCYEVIPLSPMSGLIGWVPHSDTFHQLIKEYRETHNIPVDFEKKLITKLAPRFDDLSYLQKVEIFETVLEESSGMDLANILWLKSASSEAWMERRTNFTRSVALMSMVGYILGLGDRHPSNLMLQRYTGNVVHIDFGDCFEVAIQREKFPERIPFRLTRMIVNAMDVSGIEGTFRITCEAVMKVLRMNKDSLMAVLEAFVYDPLIVRILGGKDAEDEEDNTKPKENQQGEDSAMKTKAGTVMKRVLEKLTGKDFGNEVELSVSDQVDRLIKEAISHENLSQSYQGWCPYW
ncbi:FKBP12-rapamycin complex-associated protein, putative [Entamoeba invadens IP1]|uniref:FKBP12-rapamycin complex-associated protein, putative n=1 Tax=Entamoeba invadens IP1 TaxID=370355 RepID=UPI0002C3D482|nr:FKBP12-rapamycin complex-associated protein, putative [Entamoeba invadens IP1]ELP85087.1 FKBP12-rapamycin complex-associated protein, putative [Entamoeba invadens IP1]|eukprot:XP_004184433.1 FKBP12-rapamycin complex-associated protein, putative [Entamoeba invadens IP1]